MTLNTANLQKYQTQAEELLAAGFTTKAAQKVARTATLYAYDAVRSAVQGVYLAIDNEARTKEQTNLYFDMPLYPHEWRAKHSDAIRAVLPDAAQYIPAIEAVVALVERIKNEPIVAKVKKERKFQEGDRIQYRGHCQCCGRVHATSGGYVAQHGYKVKFNEFIGVCSGHVYAPMEEKRDATDQLVKQWLADADKADATAQALQDGKLKPAKAPEGVWIGAAVLEFDKAPVSMQRRAIELAIHQESQRSRALRSHAGLMVNLANKVHGQPLQQVVIPGTK